MAVPVGLWDVSGLNAGWWSQFGSNTGWFNHTQVDAVAGGPTNYADSLSVGAYAIAGKTVSDSAARSDALSAGSYAISGKTIADVLAKNDALSAGAYAISGKSLTDAVVRADSLNSGAYAISGKNLTDTVSKADSLSTGAYSIAGQDITDAVVPAGGSSYADDLSPGVYSILGQDITDSVVSGNIDGGGGRTSYWQAYWMDKREWEKKIPPVAVKAIERVARSNKKGEAAERELMRELADYEARYGDMLRLLKQSQFVTLKALKSQQLEQLRLIQDEEDAEILLLLG